MERELTDEQIKTINGALTFSPIFSGTNLACFKVGSEVMFNNPNLSQIVINTFVTISGGQTYYDIVRVDGIKFNVDRHFMGLDFSSTSGAFVQSKIIKDFPGHNSPESFYLN